MARISHRVLPLGLLLVALVAAVVIAGCRSASKETPPNVSSPPRTETTAAPAEAAPDFTLTTLDGKTIKLADLKGKAVMVNFWASWCHFCVQEAPDLDALYKQYRSQGLEVLGIGIDDPAALEAKTKELGLTYPVGAGKDIATKYGVGPVPHTFVINREGKVVASLLGMRPKAELEAEIKRVL